MPTYIVEQGDCIVSISEQHGFYWETIWKDAGNRDLRNLRKDPMVLYPGDHVFIPERTIKTAAAGTEKRHRFVRLGIPPRVKIRVNLEGCPLSGKPYRFRIEGETFSGNVDSDGYVEIPVQSTARHGTLTVGEGNEAMYIDMDLGALNPVDTIMGVQQRLSNLGMEPGLLDGQLGPNTRAALRRFQQLNGLEPTGNLDRQTSQKLRDAHGS